MTDNSNKIDWGCVLPLMVIAGLGYLVLAQEQSPPVPVITPTAPRPPAQQPVPPPSPIAPSASPPAPAIPQPPPHNYAFKEGDVYGYIAGISEEERKQGKAAGDVILYRFAGTWDGELHLERLSATGQIVGVSSCARPCVAIKVYDGGSVERLAYNPDSIIGAAFQDALNGRLKRKVQKPPVEPTPEAPATDLPSIPEPTA